MKFPTKPTVYAVRHETTPNNKEDTSSDNRLRGWRDVPLGEKGLANLPKLAKFFVGNPIKHVVAGDMTRHQQTGLAIAQKNGTTYTPTASLRPWHHAPDVWGDRELNKGLAKEMRHYIVNRDKPLPGGKGETYGTFDNRHADGAGKVLDYVKAHPNEPTALVTGGSGINSLLAQITGDRRYHGGPDVVHPGGVIRLEYDGNRWNPTVVRKRAQGLNPVSGSGKNLATL